MRPSCVASYQRAFDLTKPTNKERIDARSFVSSFNFDYFSWQHIVKKTCQRVQTIISHADKEKRTHLWKTHYLCSEAHAQSCREPWVDLFRDGRKVERPLPMHCNFSPEEGKKVRRGLRLILIRCACWPVTAYLHCNFSSKGGDDGCKLISYNLQPSLSINWHCKFSVKNGRASSIIQFIIANDLLIHKQRTSPDWAINSVPPTGTNSTPNRAARKKFERSGIIWLFHIHPRIRPRHKRKVVIEHL